MAVEYSIIPQKGLRYKDPTNKITINLGISKDLITEPLYTRRDDYTAMNWYKYEGHPDTSIWWRSLEYYQTYNHPILNVITFCFHRNKIIKGILVSDPRAKTDLDIGIGNTSNEMLEIYGKPTYWGASGDPAIEVEPGKNKTYTKRSPEYGSAIYEDIKIMLIFRKTSKKILSIYVFA